MSGGRRESWRPLLAVTALLAACFGVVVAATASVALVGAVPASATPNDIIVPGFANPGPEAIDCMSATNCLAIGGDQYVEIVNGEDGGVQYLPDGISIESMTCPSPGICFAVGYEGVYPENPPYYLDGVVVPFDYGQAETPVLVPGTSFLTGIACTPGTTSCTAVGYEYYSVTSAPYRYGTVVSLSDGTPTDSVQDVPALIELNGIACPSSGSCLAAGWDNSTRGGGLLPITDGVPGSEVVTSAGAFAFIACSSATQCWAGSGDTITPVDSGVPGSTVTASGMDAGTMACPTATVCYLGGQNSSDEAAIMPVTSGVPGTAVVDDTSTADTSIRSLDCLSAKSCVAAGVVTGTGGGGLVVTSPLSSAPPTVKGVTFAGTGYATTVTITGSGFGAYAPEASPVDPTSCVSGPLYNEYATPESFDYATGVLSFSDSTGGWSAGEPGDCIGLVVESWSNTKAVLEFGAAYVWPLLDAGDSYQVSLLGTTYSSTADVPAVAAPSISSMSIGGFGSASPTITVEGTNFGSRVPLPSPGSPLTCVSGDTSYDYSSAEVYFSDASAQWSAGLGGDCIGIVVDSWSPTQVVFSFGAAYLPDIGPSDTLEVQLLNATLWTTATNPSPPSITGLTVTGTKAKPVITVTGSGLGAEPPAPSGSPSCVTGDTSGSYPINILQFEDNANQMDAGFGGCLGLVVSSWNNTEAVLRLGPYYPQSGSVSKGDSVTMTVLGTSFTAKASV